MDRCFRTFAFENHQFFDHPAIAREAVYPAAGIRSLWDAYFVNEPITKYSEATVCQPDHQQIPNVITLHLVLVNLISFKVIMETFAQFKWFCYTLTTWKKDIVEHGVKYLTTKRRFPVITTIILVSSRTFKTMQILIWIKLDLL